MIDLHLHGLHVHSSLGLVGVHGKAWAEDSLTLTAERVPNLAALLNGEHAGLKFDPLEFGLTLCGFEFRKPGVVAEILAGILRAARFPDQVNLDEVLRDGETWQDQVQAVQLQIQERHLRSRLARLMGVRQDALQAFTLGQPCRTRSGLNPVLQGRLLGTDVQFTLEYEHLLLYAGTVPARRITRLDDLISAAGLAAAVDDKVARNSAQASA